MRLLMLANDQQRNEIESVPFTSSVEVAWQLDLQTEPSRSTQWDACIDLLFTDDEVRWNALRATGASMIVINSVMCLASEPAIGVVRMNGWPSFLRRSIVEAAASSTADRVNAEMLFSQLGRTVSWVPDIDGLLSARIVSNIINEAFFSLEEGVSTIEEIDIAMRLGTNYPYGPFEWAKTIGLERIYDLLARLARTDDRYTACPLLEQTALA